MVSGRLMKWVCDAIRIGCSLWAIALSCIIAEAETSLDPSPVAIPVDVPGLQNVFQLTTHIYSGSEPIDSESFAGLKRLGVTTIISVDGVRPKVALGKGFGIQYIHIPVGYDGLSATNANRLVRAATGRAGALYVHCHHGRHRGPAAAALICRGLANWSAERARAWMKTAGCSPQYKGLYNSVARFQTPSKQSLDSLEFDFPESVPPSDLVDSMNTMDRHWEWLQDFRKAGYRVPKGASERDVSGEVLLLLEAVRELSRNENAWKRGDGLLERLKLMETSVETLQGFVSGFEGVDVAGNTEKPDRLWNQVQQNCRACHERYRD